MTGPEVMRSFIRWHDATVEDSQFLGTLPDAYPLYVATSGPYLGTWYVRERLPGTRVWRGEEDGSFTLLESPPMDLARREIAGRVF